METNGVLVLRQCSNGWVNGTAILKAAGVDKKGRESVLKGLGEVFRGGSASALIGTWILREKGLQLAIDYGVENLQRLLVPNLGHEDAAAVQRTPTSKRQSQPEPDLDRRKRQKTKDSRYSYRSETKEAHQDESQYQQTEDDHSEYEKSDPPCSPPYILPYCADCGKQFDTPMELKYHQGLIKSQRYLFRCTCGSQSMDPACFMTHVRKHIQDCPKRGKFKCYWDVCNRELYFREVDDHLNIHSQNPYPCVFDGCGKWFKSSGLALSHRKRHTKEGQIRCAWPKCGRVLSSADKFVWHWRTHTGGTHNEKSVRCIWERCDRLFTSKEKMERHMIAHRCTKYSLRSITSLAQPEALVSKQSMTEDDGWQAEETEESCSIDSEDSSQYSIDPHDEESEDDPSALLSSPTDSFQILGVQEDAYPPYLINQLMQSSCHGYKEINQIMGSYKYVEVPFNAYSKLAEGALLPNDFVENVRCRCEEDCFSNCLNISMFHEYDKTNCSQDGYCSNRRFSDLEKWGIQRGIEIFDSRNCGKGL